MSDDELVVPLRPRTDGVITLRPTAAIVADGQVVGWADYDTDREWLHPEEVNVGYNVFPAHRGQGYASRALELLIQHLSEATHFDTVTLLIHPENLASLAVARSAKFRSSGEINGSRYFKRSIRGL